MSASLKSSLSAAGALRLSRRNGRAVSCSGTIATAAGAVCVRVSDRTERLRCHVADGRGGLEAVVRFVPRVSVEVLLPCLTAAGKSWTALADADVLAGDLGLPDPGACLLLGWLAAAEWVERVANAAAADRTAAPADWDRRRALRPVAADRAPERDERPDWDLIRWAGLPGVARALQEPRTGAARGAGRDGLPVRDAQRCRVTDPRSAGREPLGAHG